MELFTGVHTTLADYTAGTKSLFPGGVDWTQTFSTNGVAKIVPQNGTGLSGGSAGATISFEDDDNGATWTDTSNISFNWQNANALN